MPPHQLRRRLLTYCHRRLRLVSLEDVPKLEGYICQLIDDRRSPPRRRSALDWRAISQESKIDYACLVAHRDSISPALESIARAATDWTPLPTASEPSPKPRQETNLKAPFQELGHVPPSRSPQRRAVGHDFSNKLDHLMRSNGDDSTSLHRALGERGVRIERSTLISWRNGSKSPRATESFDVLREIERHYNAGEGTLAALLPHPGRATIGFQIQGVSSAELRRLSWHLPNDFNRRTKAEQEEIIDWVRSVIITGATDYRRYQAAASRQRFGFRFIEMADRNDAGAQARLRKSVT